MGDSAALTPLQGLLSGIGHPLLGPDHLLFLLAIAFIGLQRPRAWVIPLLAAGLGGSVLSQFIPLPDAVAPWAEAMVSLSLVVEGLMALTVASTRWLLPLVALTWFSAGQHHRWCGTHPAVHLFPGPADWPRRAAAGGEQLVQGLWLSASAPRGNGLVPASGWASAWPLPGWL